MAPWQGPRHRTWARDTNIATVMFVFILGTYIIWEIVGQAPQGLVSLLGVAGGAWFGAVSGDKKKRDTDTERTAERAEVTATRAEGKADRATSAAAAGELRANAAEERERGWSQHRDHHSDDDDADGGCEE